LTLDLERYASCAHYDLSNVSVIAGHFSWDVWSSLPSFASESSRIGSIPKRIPSCFVMGRHPIDRIISSFYQLCFNKITCPFYQIRFNRLDLHDLLHFIEIFQRSEPQFGAVQNFDEGSNDASCRIIINRKVNGLSELTIEEQSMALDRINHCIIGMYEDWKGTEEVLKHWFPWLSMSDHPMGIHASDIESLSTVRSDLREVLEMMNPCDVKLYDRMWELFQLEMKVVQDDSYLIH
jgi:hypothetical protein